MIICMVIYYNIIVGIDGFVRVVYGCPCFDEEEGYVQSCQVNPHEPNRARWACAWGGCQSLTAVLYCIIINNIIL